MRRSSPPPHAPFFTSLKHLEKRLKLENHPPPLSAVPPPPPPPPSLPTEYQDTISSTQQIDSLGTPIYLNYNHCTAITNASNLQESEAPQEFLSNSPDFPPTHQILPQENHSETQITVDLAERSNLDDDIQLLMQLLHLSDSDDLKQRACVNDAGCDDGFYEKIVGVKGPKSVKEAERLERWIKHFLNGEKREPLRLAHLLLAKAAFLQSDEDCDGFGGFVFPSTVDEFLQNDPPPVE